MSSSSRTLLVAGTVVLGAFAVSQFFHSSERTPSSSGGATDLDDDEDGEFIDEELVCKVFDRLFMEMQMVIAQLGQQVQQLQMAGQRIPEAQLKGILKAEFERALAARQTAVFEDHNVDADCLEEATWEFLANEDVYPKVKTAVERFQKLYETITDETVVGRRPGVKVQTYEPKVLTADETIVAAKVYFGSLTDAMRDLVRQFKVQGKDIKSMMGQRELQMAFAEAANDAGDKALSTMELTLKDFQASVEKHAANPMVGRELQALQMAQQQEMAQMMT